jgi:hypothetical protein
MRFRYILLLAFLLGATAGLVYQSCSAQAQPSGPGQSDNTGESSVKAILAHMNFKQMAGIPRIVVLNGTSAVIDSITCTYSSSTTYTFAGDGVDKSVADNVSHIPSGKGTVLNTKGWDSYCPKGLLAHLDNGMDVLGELDKPNDFSGSKWVIFWEHSVNH